MGRFYGNVGYALVTETSPGVWTEDFTERSYYGDIQRLSRSLREAQGLNDDITVSSTVSVLADEFMYEHIHAIRYVVMYGSKWRVSSVEVRRPRLTLMVGEVYNA